MSLVLGSTLYRVELPKPAVSDCAVTCVRFCRLHGAGVGALTFQHQIVRAVRLNRCVLSLAVLVKDGAAGVRQAARGTGQQSAAE